MRTLITYARTFTVTYGYDTLLFNISTKLILITYARTFTVTYGYDTLLFHISTKLILITYTQTLLIYCYECLTQVVPNFISTRYPSKVCFEHEA